MLELTNINNALDSQDEEDRQSISLWGMHDKYNGAKTKQYGKSIDHIRKSNTKEKLKLSKIRNQSGEYNVITIDKNCLSWTNSNPAILSAFKMACLAYYPSNIIFEGKSLPRALLHQRKVNIIQNLYSNYHNLQPWKSGKCNFDKYLDIDTISLLNSKQSIKNRLSIMSVSSKFRNPSSIIHRKSHTPNENSIRKGYHNSLLTNDRLKISPFRQEVLKNKTIQISHMELEEFKDDHNYKLNNTFSLEPISKDNDYAENIITEHISHLDLDMNSTRNEQNIQILGRNIKTPFKHSFTRTKKLGDQFKKNKIIHLSKLT